MGLSRGKKNNASLSDREITIQIYLESDIGIRPRDWQSLSEKVKRARKLCEIIVTVIDTRYNPNLNRLHNNSFPLSRLCNIYPVSLDSVGSKQH